MGSFVIGLFQRAQVLLYRVFSRAGTELRFPPQQRDRDACNEQCGQNAPSADQPVSFRERPRSLRHHFTRFDIISPVCPNMTEKQEKQKSDSRIMSQVKPSLGAIR